ncbi:unnamed protein product [Arabis nemorensis]|uniref:Uncharacterized protein n=1 Tax=Arabis nemorensis TaxID=586526 RepID=A0A565BUV6_9BRAS|nr:unnamed protein product [Arabis nemorensis]
MLFSSESKGYVKQISSVFGCALTISLASSKHAFCPLNELSYESIIEAEAAVASLKANQLDGARVVKAFEWLKSIKNDQGKIENLKNTSAEFRAAYWRVQEELDGLKVGHKGQSSTTYLNFNMCYL